MNVAELRKALEGLPDEMPVLVYDEGYLTDEVSVAQHRCAPKEGQTVLTIDFWDKHPKAPLFLIIS